MGTVVIVVQDLTSSPYGPRQKSQRPAKAKGSPDFITTRMGLLGLLALCHSQKPSAMTRHRRLANAVRKLGRSATVSALALISRLPTEALLAQEGISPQRRCAGCLPSSLVTANTGCVGAIVIGGGKLDHAGG